MDFVHGLFILCITLILINHNLKNVEGRSHFHKEKKVTSPIPSESSNSSPSVPSDPYPNDPRDSSSDCVFDVRYFGAVGDGLADDTPAFKKAWKEACAVESGTILVPENYTFKITSTIFSGPCKPGLVFQVRLHFQFPISNFQFHHIIYYDNSVNKVEMKSGGWCANSTRWT